MDWDTIRKMAVSGNPMRTMRTSPETRNLTNGRFMRILHVLDHSVPLQSGYVTRSLGIIRSQRAHGWETLHLTGPKHPSGATRFETVDGLDFYRTPKTESALPLLLEI